MSKLTPGPWIAQKAIEAVYEQDHYIMSPSGVVGYWKGGRSWHTDDKWVLTEADARLIAAAPELLESVQELLGCMHLANWEDDPIAIKARAALAKARGEQ